MNHPDALRSIARIAVPTSLEMVFQLVLTFAVQLAVGVLGTLALAAAGLVNSLVLVILVSFSTIGAAAAILVARAHGAHDHDRVARVTTTAEALAFACTLALCLPAALLAGSVLKTLGAPLTSRRRAPRTFS
ncbi:MATE family efflux transporter [Deinococcus malanensis]|uniref:MATE family efflux transporter n=1 Tax=Deinococcus malanensis TaxID=1706855 RepID=UPI00363CBA02